MSDSAPAIGIGMLSYAFMGKAHANAYRTLSYMTAKGHIRPAGGSPIPGLTALRRCPAPERHRRRAPRSTHG